MRSIIYCKLIIFSILKFSILSFPQDSVIFNRMIFKKIHIFNENDCLDGYINFVNDSAFYISKWDLNNQDTLCSNYSKELTLNPYLIFSLKSNDTLFLIKHPCDVHPIYGGMDYREIRNILYPPLISNEGFYIIKHVSTIYNSNDFFIREFFISTDNEILKIKSFGKKDELYFFYD